MINAPFDPKATRQQFAILEILYRHKKGLNQKDIQLSLQFEYNEFVEYEYLYYIILFLCCYSGLIDNNISSEEENIFKLSTKGLNYFKELTIEHNLDLGE
jgi:hypothetical protein